MARSSEPTPDHGTFLDVVTDDFSDPRSGFPTADYETERVSYEDGALHLRLKAPARATWTMRDLGDWPLADVTATLTPLEVGGTGFFGLTCGASNDAFYAGLVDSAGDALLLRIAERLPAPLDRQPRAIVPPVPHQGVRLKLECVGSDAGAAAAGAILWVDDRPVAMASDPLGVPSFRRAGLYAESTPESPTFVVAADDFGVRVGLRADPGSGPSASASLTGDPATDALAAHVPEASRGACRKTALAGVSPEVAVDCAAGTMERASYLQYASTAQMDAAYDAFVAAHPEATGAACAVSPSEGPYTVDQVPAGRLLCFERDGRASVVWTDERLDILAYATAGHGSFADLYDWWLAAGPVP